MTPLVRSTDRKADWRLCVSVATTRHQRSPRPEISWTSNTWGDQAQGADDAVEFPVGDFNRDESDDVVAHLFEVHFPPSGLQHT